MVKLTPILLLFAALPGSALAQERATKGLQALYDFSAPSGDVVKDRSGVAPALDLRIANPKNVRRSKGALEIQKGTILRPDSPAMKLQKAIRRSSALTIETWIRPADIKQAGPARIVTLSRDSSNRNFTLGQDGDKVEVRLRTDKTSNNGIPSLPAPNRTLKTKLTHVVYTHDRSGRTAIYLDGKKVAEKKISGTTRNWDDGYRFALGNEHTSDRPWLGNYYLVAIYDRGLSQKEVTANFMAGVDAPGAPVIAERDPSEELFDTKVAAIIANHCLECHDAATRKGKLDLSHKATAFAGGREGPPITPGKSGESLLWETVASDEMPEDRPPLSEGDKEALKKWIDSGAKWTGDYIDPADYAHRTQVAQNFIRRLTIPEYIATVRAATGVDISVEARRLLPPDLRADGFSNTAYNLNIDLKHVGAYAQLASTIVDRMDVAKFAKRFSKNRSLTDKPMRAHIESIGKWMLRGPLEGYELDAFRGISTTVASAGGDFDEAVRYILEAMLQSPRFIYHMEDQRDTQPSDHELAARISYIVWGAPPDSQLITAAERGELQDPSGLDSQVRRMLKDARAVDRSVQFLNDWLHLGRLDNLSPNKKRFPDWDQGLASDMRNETIEFFKEVVWKQKRPMADLLNAQVTFVTPGLATHYGLKPVSNIDVPARYDLSKTAARGGLLTQGSVLTIGGDDASMVTRGLFVLHDLLRGTVKDPPPGTDTTPVPSQPGVTQRSVAIDRIRAKACGGCHSKFEPLAFGLEKFDGLGGFSNQDEHGNALREDGEILLPGAAEPTSYESAAELMDLLAKSDRVAQTITRKVTQFSLGRPLTFADKKAIGQIHAAATKNGGTYAALVRAIVASDLVQTNRTGS